MHQGLNFSTFVLAECIPEPTDEPTHRFDSLRIVCIGQANHYNGNQLKLSLGGRGHWWCVSVLGPLQFDFTAIINLGPPSKWRLAGGPMVARFLYAYLIMVEQGSRCSYSE